MNKPVKKSSGKISIPLKNRGMKVSIRGRQIALSAMAVVYLLIDCSISMSGGSKLQQAKNGAKEFAAEARRKGYSIGLIKFSSDAVCLFDPDQQNREFSLNSSINSVVASGSTNMTEAIEIAIEKLISVSGSRVMLVATDGQPNSSENALKAAEQAKALGIEILAIGTDDADISFLRKLATLTELADKVPATQFKNAITSMADRLALPSGDAR